MILTTFYIFFEISLVLAVTPQAKHSESTEEYTYNLYEQLKLYNFGSSVSENSQDHFEVSKAQASSEVDDLFYSVLSFINVTTFDWGNFNEAIPTLKNRFLDTLFSVKSTKLYCEKICARHKFTMFFFDILRDSSEQLVESTNKHWFYPYWAQCIVQITLRVLCDSISEDTEMTSEVLIEITYRMIQLFEFFTQILANMPDAPFTMRIVISRQLKEARRIHRVLRDSV